MATRAASLDWSMWFRDLSSLLVFQCSGNRGNRSNTPPIQLIHHFECNLDTHTHTCLGTGSNVPPGAR